MEQAATEAGTLSAKLLKPEKQSDNELVECAREGDRSAYAELWQRHYPAGLAIARSLRATFDPDDLVSEAFTRIYKALLAGGGPSVAFRPYLFTSIRNIASTWGQASKEVPIDDAETIQDPRFLEENQLAALRSMAAQAFRQPPAAWQEVLWYTEVERMSPRDLAPMLGLRPNSVAALAYRAREGLRQSWIQTHLATVEDDSECRRAVEHLGAKIRGKWMDGHLHE